VKDRIERRRLLAGQSQRGDVVEIAAWLYLS
jgi:hypothetical protein